MSNILMNELEGFIETVTFKNDENGYGICKFRTSNNEIITIVGILAYTNEGQKLKLKGEWVIHPTFGRQFKVESFEEIIPDSIVGIEKYLASGLIKGIGPVTAKKIVQKFGTQSLEVLDNDIDRLNEIEGIGKKKIDIIKESYMTQREVQKVMVFFQGYGVTISQCTKIYKQYGSLAIDIVKENPYVLCEEISGIGFKSADKIALNIGINHNSPFRIRSGIKYIINDFCMLGHTYMPLKELVPKVIEILGVNKEDVEAEIDQSVLDGNIIIEKINEEDCVFTLLYYYSELSVTKNICSLAIEKYKDLNVDIQHEIEVFEKGNGVKFAPSQKEAIEGIAENGIEIITGGPGTGKTTIINCILNIFENCGMRVFMAAPTGRAAKRMSEATGRETKTIHRLLELGFKGEDEEIPLAVDQTLECDVIIIDEASMIDIMLMNNLLKKISIGTRVIIVGDVDQLPSVGPGNVLRDLIESNVLKVVRLKEIFRQSKDSMIILNAHKINNKEMPLLNEKSSDFYFIAEEEQEKILRTLLQLINERLPKFNGGWDKIRDMQILSPMRKGVLGVANLNIELQKILNPPDKYKKEKKFKELIFRVGDKVMQIKNNYSLVWNKINSNDDNEGSGVFNGDVGYIEYISEETNTMSVIFDDERRVIYEDIFLDELDLAYAVTIHKSQGSEFPVVVMPCFMGPQLLMNKNLLYTGVTRAKKLVVLVGSRKTLHFMINNEKGFLRYSSLKWRIKELINTEKGGDF